MVQKLHWLGDGLHLGSLEEAIEHANRYLWNLSIVEGRGEYTGQWSIFSGESLIFSADSREAVDAFLYGMGLAYHDLPDECVTLFEKSIGPVEDDQ